MKTFIPMLLIFLAVTVLCIWDSIHIDKTFEYLEKESTEIYTSTLNTDITDAELGKRINNLNIYWTKEMDKLCISISRKDLQIVSDYLQYLCTAVINENQEDAITYSRLLNYNIQGLNQANGISTLTLL